MRVRGVSVARLLMLLASWGSLGVLLLVGLVSGTGTEDGAEPLADSECYSAAYCGSKAAVINMTRADAIDYAGDGLRINCVCPGVVETPLTTSSDDVHRSMQEKALETPFGRMAKPHEIADSILFLCSSKASFIQGHALVVDGGYTIQ